MTPTQIRLQYHTYPGHPLVSAAVILLSFKSLDDAAAPAKDPQGRPLGFFAAEGCSDVPGAGGQASKAIFCLRKYRNHRNVDALIADLHEMWKRTLSPSNFEDRYEEGMKKARLLEPWFREALTNWAV